MKRQNRAKRRRAFFKKTRRVAKQLELIKRVVDNVPGMLAYWDSNQRCRFANAAYESWFGVKPEALLGKSMAELLGPIYLRNRPFIEGALRGERQTFEREIPDPAGGRSRHSQASYVPDISDGVVRGFSVMVSDVSDLKRMQAEFLAAQRWALVGTLAAGVAHEINTPIQYVGDNVLFLRGAITGLFALIEAQRALTRAVVDGADAPTVQAATAAVLQADKASRWAFWEREVPSALDACSEGLARIAVPVRSLKEFAHPGVTETEAADINHIIERTLAIASSEYKHVARLETDFAALPRVRCNIGQISQVVLNLVVNAAHAIADRVSSADEQGVLRVETRIEGDRVLIAITDTGAGIAEAIQPKIFDPFFTTKPVGKGSGQGLAIARQLVTQNHKGELRFETTLGRGTTFFVYLPIE